MSSARRRVCGRDLSGTFLLVQYFQVTITRFLDHWAIVCQFLRMWAWFRRYNLISLDFRCNMSPLLSSPSNLYLDDWACELIYFSMQLQQLLFLIIFVFCSSNIHLCLLHDSAMDVANKDLDHQIFWMLLDVNNFKFNFTAVIFLNLLDGQHLRQALPRPLRQKGDEDTYGWSGCCRKDHNSLQTETWWNCNHDPHHW